MNDYPGVTEQPEREPVEIRPVSQQELEVLEKTFPTGSSRFHHARFARQEAGTGTYLIGWWRGQPVGHVLIRWPGPDNEMARRTMPGFPELNALEVSADLRGAGIGTQLIMAVEKEAAGRGNPGVILAVDVENHGARRLYERLGYHDWGFGESIDEYDSLDENGRIIHHEDRVNYLVKRFDQ